MARVFTVDEAADYLHVTPYTIRKWLRKGKIPGRKIGRIYRILEDELQAVLQGHHIAFERIRPGQLTTFPSRRGWTTEDFLREKHEETLEEERRWKMRQWNGLSREEKQQRIEAVMGKYADVPFSSEDLIRERREEVEREERSWKEHDEQ